MFVLHASANHGRRLWAIVACPAAAVGYTPTPAEKACGFRDSVLMDIVIDRLPRDAGLDLAVRGRLDAESAGELRLAVSEEVRRGWQSIALDLSAVTFLSSAGIRVLFETQREARKAGGDCLVSVASDPVRKVLELTRLDTILMRPAAPDGLHDRVAAKVVVSRDIEVAALRLVGLEDPSVKPLLGRRVGSALAMTASDPPSERLVLSGTSFAIGLAAVPGEGATVTSAGESLAACGAVYHRPPRPFAMVDYVHGTGDLVPELDMITGLAWEGVPSGRGWFEPVGEAAAVGIDELAAALLDLSPAGLLAVVMIGEVHGLVAAELIRPLAEATSTDHLLVGKREVASRWICFSREPAHAGRTAMVVGVISRETTGPLSEMVAPLGQRSVSGHLHAVVFPHRSLKRAASDLETVAADLASSEPMAVVHLLADDRPVLGSGVSQLVRGSLWFAPLTLSGGDA
jgi:anti-sigma B factor antagonist/stage II sporulation protein AA (anti-sigma F factor antagonist)